MGIIILFVGFSILFLCVSILFAFLLGILSTLKHVSYKDNYTRGFLISMGCFLVSVGLSIAATQEYYEKKELSSVKYNLKQKVVTDEEDNTVKLDTINTFIHK